MFTFIREAEARIKLGKQAKTAERAQQLLGVSSLAEMMSPTEFEITPADYQEWLKAIISIAEERGFNVSKKIDFMDLAHDLLDDDPKLDAIGGDRILAKRNIVNALWQAYKVNQAHTAVQDHVAKTVRRAQQDEEDANGLVGSDSVSGFAQTFNAAKGVENEEMKRRNPYRPGTLRHALWAQNHSSMEDEAFDQRDQMSTAAPSDKDIDSMTADQLASHIMGVQGGGGEMNYDDSMDDMDDGMSDQPEDMDDGMSTDMDDQSDDITARVDDLEARVADLEGDDVDGTDARELDADPIDDMDDASADVDMDQMTADADDTDDQFPSSQMKAAPKNLEDEQRSDPLRVAITSPRDQMTAALKAVEDEGVDAFMRLAMPKNPHPPKSQAYHAWEKGFKASFKQAMGLSDKPKAPQKSKRRR